MFSQQPPLSELERIELFTRLIDAFPKGHPLKRYRGDVYHELNNFEVLFRTMKRQGWTSTHINGQVADYLGSLEAPSGLWQKNGQNNCRLRCMNMIITRFYCAS
ncbi:hypothetical protein [Paraflavitalea speifideaquila]|uniref:hypothetical protein n=1 Tax=Paraflavitalea speifideaquila TaxID=3076558 RepID=UPI0028E19DDF|nr:hypothetical protein [Paraflavitalea speifideiaquila]